MGWPHSPWNFWVYLEILGIPDTQYRKFSVTDFSSKWKQLKNINTFQLFPLGRKGANWKFPVLGIRYTQNLQVSVNFKEAFKENVAWP